MSGRPRTACRRCNSHKVRCSGLRPVCHRCQRAGKQCYYDTPNTGAPQPDHSDGASQLPKRARISAQPLISHQESLSSKVPSCGIPPGLLIELVDVYFSHVGNATLLLHKATFLQRLRRNDVQHHVILSVCAMASKFYRDPGGEHLLVQQGFSQEWATQAGQLVFKEVEKPQDENIVTFLNLSLFWYSEGKWARCAVHKANALLIARLSGLSSSWQGAIDRRPSEIQIRRHWACFLMVALGPELDIKREFAESMRELSFPCVEEVFEKQGEDRRATPKSNTRDGSLHGELLRAMTFWTEVSLQVQKVFSSPASRLAAIHQLDSEISEWWAGLPPSLELRGEDTSSHYQNAHPLVMFLHAVYHQCFCSLHASIVPLFCRSNNLEHPAIARHMSAQIAFRHACAISNLAKVIHNATYDVSRTPSFLGYACYCACAILIPFLRCKNLIVREQCRQDMIVNLELIQQIGKYWKFISLLGPNLRTIYDMHLNCPFIPDDEPKNMDAAFFHNISGDSQRLTSSILEHNNIIRGSTGSVALSDAEITGPGLRPTHPPEQQVIENEDPFEMLIVELSAPTCPNADESIFQDEPFNLDFLTQNFPMQLDVESMNGGSFFFPHPGPFTLDELQRSDY